ALLTTSTGGPLSDTQHHLGSDPTGRDTTAGPERRTTDASRSAASNKHASRASVAPETGTRASAAPADHAWGLSYRLACSRPQKPCTSWVRGHTSSPSTVASMTRTPRGRLSPRPRTVVGALISIS